MKTQKYTAQHDWIWMPHAGHFICGHLCEFKLNTYVNGYIISTVGELRIDGQIVTVGCDRKYETMVFKAKKSKHKCCLYVQCNGQECDFKGYNTPEDAYLGHMEFCRKYDNIK
jgi:hypothetical protein